MTRFLVDIPTGARIITLQCYRVPRVLGVPGCQELTWWLISFKIHLVREWQRCLHMGTNIGAEDQCLMRREKGHCFKLWAAWGFSVSSKYITLVCPGHTGRPGSFVLPPSDNWLMTFIECLPRAREVLFIYCLNYHILHYSLTLQYLSPFRLL